MKKYILPLLLIFSVNFAFAQDFFDALRYSQTEYGGTARSIAMGSAFGALGSDFISASINPAGLGLYRSGEFTVSPTLNINQKEALYLGNYETNDKYKFNFNNLSYVGTVNTGNQSGIVSVSFGIGYNRLKNFHSNAYIQGYNANTTLLNYFTDYANIVNDLNALNYHYEGMAWNTWLIDEDPDPMVIEGIYYNDLTNYESYDLVDENNNFVGIGYEAIGVKPHQQKSMINQSGRIDEYSFSVGVNAGHKFYMGASLGLVDLQFDQDIMYSEIDNNNNSDYLKSYTLNTNLIESGFGVNFKTGIIYRPIKSLRLGLAFHTPTFYTISKDESKTLTANFEQVIGNDDTDYSSSWEDRNSIYYSYKLETPLKLNLSAAYTLGNIGILSVDYERINYSGSKFRHNGDNYDYSDHNSDINNVFNAVANIRVGGEVRVSPNISLRGGYGIMGNPWKDTYSSNGVISEILNKDDKFNAYSAGFGYRQQNFFFDFAYRLNHAQFTQKVHEIYNTNPDGGNATATLTELNHQATLTFGFRF